MSGKGDWQVKGDETLHQTKSAVRSEFLPETPQIGGETGTKLYLLVRILGCEPPTLQLPVAPSCSALLTPSQQLWLVVSGKHRSASLLSCKKDNRHKRRKDKRKAKQSKIKNNKKHFLLKVA